MEIPKLPDPKPVAFRVKQDQSMLLEVQGSDGKLYDLAIASIIVGIQDTGFVHPITRMPIFKVHHQEMDMVTLAKPNSVH